MMAAQAQARPMARWETGKTSSGGIIGQITAVFTSPKTFFQRMPRTRHWVFIALLILFIAGFSATSQKQTSTTNSTTQSTAVNTGAAPSGSSATGSQTARTTSQTAATTGGTTSTGSATSAAVTPTSQQSTSTDTNTTLMAALIAASGMLVMWVGQSVLLCLVTMLQGYAPNLGRSMQVAVWASMPLALMYLLRQVNFAAGGSGGAVGLSLLLTQWRGYAQLGDLAQRIIATFLSNLSLFWLWNLVLLFLGARYALGGNRWAVVLVTVMWIVSAAVVPALVGTPSTTTGPRSSIVATPQKTTTTSGSSTTTQQQPGADMFGGGMPPSGPPPSGAMQGGNAGSSGSSASGSR